MAECDAGVELIRITLLPRMCVERTPFTVQFCYSGPVGLTWRDEELCNNRYVLSSRFGALFLSPFSRRLLGKLFNYAGCLPIGSTVKFFVKSPVFAMMYEACYIHIPLSIKVLGIH